MEWYFSRNVALLDSNVVILTGGCLLFFFVYGVLRVQNRTVLTWAVGYGITVILHLLLEFAQHIPLLSAALFLLCDLCFSSTLLVGLLYMMDMHRGIRHLQRLYLVFSTLLLAVLPVLGPGRPLEVWSSLVMLCNGGSVAVVALVTIRRERSLSHIPIHICMMINFLLTLYSSLRLLWIDALPYHTQFYPLVLLLMTVSLFIPVIQCSVSSIVNTRVRLEKLVENTSYGLAFLSEAGELLEINEKLLQILGTSWDRRRNGLPRPDDIGLSRLLEAGTGELVFQPKNGGQPLRLAITSKPIGHRLGGQPGIFLQVEDITEERRTLEDMATRQYQMNLLFEMANAFELIWMDERLQAPRLLETLGFHLDEIPFLELMERIHPDDRYKVNPIVAREKQNVVSNRELRLRHANGHYLWFLFNWKENLLDGKPYTIGVALCMDEHKRIEQRMAQNEKLTALGQLAGGVAHDMNNHLMTIQTSLTLMNRTADEVQRRKYASIMQEAINNSTAMLRSLLSFSRGQQEGHTNVPMQKMVEVTLSLLERALTVKIHLNYEDEAGPAVVVGNYYELQNVLLNLGLNARDAMGQGGDITVRTWLADANPGMPDHVGRWYMLSVTDTGCGMEPEVLRHIFEPFFTTKAEGSGSGLGLSITYGIVQHHGGTITVQSQPGVGTCFTLALPLAADQLIGCDMTEECMTSESLNQKVMNN